VWIEEKQEHLNNIRNYSYYKEIAVKSFKWLAHNASSFEDWHEICQQIEPSNPLYRFVLNAMKGRALNFEHWHILRCYTPLEKSDLQSFATHKMVSSISTSEQFEKTREYTLWPKNYL